MLNVIVGLTAQRIKDMVGSCLLVCLSVCMSVCLFYCLSVCLSVCLSACLPVSPSLSLSLQWKILHKLHILKWYSWIDRYIDWQKERFVRYSSFFYTNTKEYWLFFVFNWHAWLWMHFRTFAHSCLRDRSSALKYRKYCGIIIAMNVTNASLFNLHAMGIRMLPHCTLETSAFLCIKNYFLVCIYWIGRFFGVEKICTTDFLFLCISWHFLSIGYDY